MCFNISCYSGAHTAHSTEVKQTLYTAQNVIIYRAVSFQGEVGNGISPRSKRINIRFWETAHLPLP